MAFSASFFSQQILLEENGFLVVNKPYDIPSTGRTLDDGDSVQYWLIELKGAMVWAVHQLDADTSGVNIFVTEKKLVGTLQKCMSKRETVKRYLAVVHGTPEWEEMSCTEPIGYVDERSLGVHPEGRSAESHFTVLQRGEKHSLMQAEIVTGRTHQIRIHLTHLGHQLVGEEWYGDEPCTFHHRQALHAWQLYLAEPFNLLLESPLPEDYLDLMEKVGLKIPS